MSDDFEGLLEALNRSGVEFILVGGLAAAVHGCLTLEPPGAPRILR